MEPPRKAPATDAGTRPQCFYPSQKAKKTKKRTNGKKGEGRKESRSAACVVAVSLRAAPLWASQAFRSNPSRTEERLEQGSLGHCLGPVLEEVIFQGLSIYGRSFCSPGACPRRGRLSPRSSGSLGLLDCASHDCRTQPRSSFVVLVLYGLSVRLGPTPISINCGSGSRPRSVQPGTLPQLLERPFC